jgi:hypothetical protein
VWLDAQILGGGRDPGALLLGRCGELGRPAEIEQLPGGGETLPITLLQFHF